MDRYSSILDKYANNKRCVVICPSAGTRTDVAALLDSTATSMNLTKAKGINIHVNKTESAQVNKLEDRRLTVWNIKSLYKDKYLTAICQHKYDYLYVYDLKEKDLMYVVNTVGKYCSEHVIDCNVDDSSTVTTSSDGLISLLDGLTLDSNSVSTMNSDEFMKEKLSILDQNYSTNESIRRSTLLTKSASTTVPKPNTVITKTKCSNIEIVQCTVINVPRMVTRYIKRYGPGSSMVSLINVSSTATNDEHVYYIDAISRLNKGRIYTWKKTNSTDDMDCIFVCSDHTVRPIGEYKQLIYIVDDPGRTRSNYSKKFGEELHNCVQNILSLDVEKIVIVCNEYYSGYYSISTNVQPHPIHDIVQKHSKNISISQDVHSKYSIPGRCNATDYIKSIDMKYTVTHMNPTVDASTLDMIVEQLVYTLECPYDEVSATNRWYSMDTNIDDTYYSPDGTLVDFHIQYRSGGGYVYSTDLHNLLVSMLFYGVRTGVYINNGCYLITR